MRSYISGLNFSNTMHAYIEYTQPCIVQKLLAGVSKTNKRNDIRKPITMSMLKQIIGTLPNMLSSYFEAILFASICSLAFFVFLRIGEVFQSGIADHTIEVDAICIDYMQNIINVTINSSKTDQYCKKETLQISKNIEKKHLSISKH